MRPSQILLVAMAIAILVLSSDMAAEVSASAASGGAGCRSIILYPTKPCDAAACQKDCSAQIEGAVGTCYGPPFYKGCDCESCPPASATTSAPAAPRKLMN